MAYQNNSRKFAMVVNRSHSVSVIMNAVAHAAFGLADKVTSEGRPLSYANGAAGFEARISEFPFIVLETRNSRRLAGLLKQARAVDGVKYNVFTTSMIGPSADAQLRATAGVTEESLDYVLVLLFGERERVDPLTKKYSLFKAEP